MKRRPLQSFPLGWTVTQLDKTSGRPRGEAIPAKVPGDVFSDLLAAGKIPDPYIGLNSRQVLWVNDHDWLYRGQAESVAPAGEGGRLWLEFMGLDYRYDIGWAGRRLRDEGMFSRVRLEAPAGQGGAETIEVRLMGLPDHWSEAWFPPIIINSEPARRKYLKTQMSFGWDFAPRLKGCGIWDRVTLFRTGPALIDDVLVRTKNSGELDLVITLDSSIETEAVIELLVRGETFEGVALREAAAVRLQPGRNQVARSFWIEAPRLWWPWDQGRPELYRLAVTARVGGEVSDAADEVFGFREIGWARNPGSPKQALDWTLLVNGRREFMRGANVVPLDSMPGRLTDERRDRLLAMTRDANLNAIRLWGGGNRERDEVYEACDRLGLLVWQEFPIGCINFGLPRSARFMARLERECVEIVRQLRNHPSVFMWCGGNEFNVHLNRPAIAVMERACREHDPSRRFTAASPYRGDAHNWRVWHLKGNLSDYFEDPSQVVSEFGLQAAPKVESLRRFLPEGLLWPVGEGWSHHHQGRGKMEKYLGALGGLGGSLEDYVAGSQKAQAYFLKRGIEHWRRAKYRKSGALIWQWNDPWPNVSWSLVDYYLEPKLGYDAVKLAFQPLLVSAEFEQKCYRAGEKLAARIVLVNDLPRSFERLAVEVKINGETRQTLEAVVGPDEVAVAGDVSLDLHHDAPSLELVAKEAGVQVSANCYDLRLHDPARAPWLLRRLFKHWWQFLSE